MITTYHQGEMTVIRGRDKPIEDYYNKNIIPLGYGSNLKDKGTNFIKCEENDSNVKMDSLCVMDCKI